MVPPDLWWVGPFCSSFWFLICVVVFVWGGGVCFLFSLSYLRSLSCVPNVAYVSELSFVDLLFFFSVDLQEQFLKPIGNHTTGKNRYIQIHDLALDLIYTLMSEVAIQ